MKVLAVVLTLCAVGKSLVLDQLFLFDRENARRLEKGDNITSEKYRISETVVFYDNAFNGIAVSTDGFTTLGVIDRENEEIEEAILAPFLFDVDGTNGEVYFEESTDERTLSKATEDVKRAFEETATTFAAKAVYVTTWVGMQSSAHPGVTFTFQSAVATDGLSSYAIFLYPERELAAGDTSILDRVTVRVGFSDRGGDQLEVLSASDLLEGGNTDVPGQWIFQIGSIFLTLEENQDVPLHHIRADPTHHRRQAGFEVSEVNFNEEPIPDDDSTCESLQCDPTNSNCLPFTDGYCCSCIEGYFGNGDGCVKIDDPVRHNGMAEGYVIVMNPDNTWTNETARSVNVHAYANTKDGRVFSVLNGVFSTKFVHAIQPMSIFDSTLGWVFAKATAPAINGFQLTGGKLTSETYVRYNTGPYEFRIYQEYDRLEDENEGEGKVLGGKVTFSGRLPFVEEGLKASFDDYTQVYVKTGPGSVRSRNTLSYTVGDTKHSYSIDQRISFDSCAGLFDEIPQNLAVDVSSIFIEYFKNEGNLRYAMNNLVRPDEEIGVHPTEPTPAPTPDTPVPSIGTTQVVTRPPITLTLCEQQLQEAQRIQQEAPYSTEQLFFPTCTELGTFAPRQCMAYNGVCWCVNQDTGEEIDGTSTVEDEGYNLDCSEVEPPPAVLTPCQEDRAAAERARIAAGSAASLIFMSRCMESGAFEPVQQLPDGSFMCVDFDGEELSRSTEEPQCLTPCQLSSYIAKSSNIFLETNLFEVNCLSDGEYAPKQCVESYCYCADRNGIEIPNSRVETTFRDDVDVNCNQFEPTPTSTISTTTSTTTTTTTTQPPPPARVGRLLFAQTMGINSIDLPVTRENSVSRRLFGNSDQTAIAVAYDCARKTYYWSDVSKRRIYSSVLDGDGSRRVVISDRLRSPEGIAVDFLNGNIYWTDSEYNSIEVSSADGSNRMTVASGYMVNPRGIAVDPIRGRMYWTDWNRAAPKIWIADMDGENRRVLVSKDLGLPNDITIDFYHQRVCFVDAGTYKVECMSLDGQGRQTIYQMKRVPRPHPFGLAIDGDVLYYSSWGGSKVIHAVNWRTGDHIPIAGPRGAHGRMYGVEIAHSQCPRGNNYCAYNNGGCSHLCLPKPNGRVCKCPVGATNCEEG